jgi:hypothetical protein
MTTDSTTVSALANPKLANKLVEEALASVEKEAESQPVKVEADLPPDLTVQLPGGLFNPFEGVTTTAEIRELTGADEEAIARIPDAGKALLTILERATVKIGDKNADQETLDLMLAGDREAILLAIRKATFGTEVILGPGECPECGEEQTFYVDLDKDVEMKKLKDEDREFIVSCKVGKVAVMLPSGFVQKSIINSGNKNAAELDTLLLKGCITSINGNPIITMDTIKNLSLKDRRTIISEIITKNPGPQLAQVTKECTVCGTEVPLPLTLADLFRE